MDEIGEEIRAAQALNESKEKPPRQWLAMMGEWIYLMLGLSSITGVVPPERIDEQPSAATMPGLWLRAWRWMWMLPPGGEARKTAFTLGEAAFWIDRWRTCITMVPFRPDHGFPICEGFMVGPDDDETPLHASEEEARDRPEAITIRQRAEAALRILRWHLDDARAEAGYLARWPNAPRTPAGRVYEGRFEVDKVRITIATADGGRETKLEDVPPGELAPVGATRRVVRVNGDELRGSFGGVWGSTDWPAGVLAVAILDDHFQHREADARRLWPTRFDAPFPGEVASYALAMAFYPRFADLCIASIPPAQPWVMTTADVSWFINLIGEAS